ncbi:MAG: glycosyltransferase [Candidatus Cloacimonetes bacterium]|nr:glycosyltransferase [Candidatus Cloacimonadota bacterium]
MLVVSRAGAVLGPDGLRYQNLDGSYLEGIARGVRSMTLLCPIQRLGQDETAAVYAGYNHRFSTPALQILELPDYKTRSVSLRGGLRQVLSQFRLIWRQLDGHDTVFVMMSTFRAAFAAVAGRLRGRRVILYSGNDWYADMASSYKFKGPLARLVYPFFRWFCGFAERRAMGAAQLRIVNGVSLVRKYGKLPGRTVETKPLVTIRPADIAPRRDTCQTPRVRLLCVAGLMPRKGIQFLLEAMALLRSEGRETHLTLVGGEQPETGARLRALCVERGLVDAVEFAGYVANGPDLIQRYRESDLFVLPSLSEGFPRVIFEAMAQSLPVVASRIPNIEGRLGDVGYLQYAAPGDPRDLARAISAVISNGELRRSMIARCHEYIGELLRESPVDQFLREAARLD